MVDQSKRSGSQDAEGYPSVRSHKLFEGLDFDNILTTKPPTISPYLPMPTSTYEVPDHLEPGLNNQRLLELTTDELPAPAPAPVARTTSAKYTYPLRDQSVRSNKLASQESSCPFHQMVEGNLILKQGIVSKRKVSSSQRLPLLFSTDASNLTITHCLDSLEMLTHHVFLQGLFARRRMLMLTEGPRLFYADPSTMTLKGEIPWSASLSTEIKSFKVFFVHTVSYPHSF